MPQPPPHPVPTVRQGLITALDKQQTRLPLDTLLEQRGLDLSQPYRKVEAHAFQGCDLSEQDMLPAPEAP